MKLYEITNEALKLEEAYMQAIDEETGEIIPEKWEEIQEKDEELKKLFKEKTDSIVMYQQNLASDIAAIKAEEQRLAKRRKTLEKKLEWLKSYLLTNMLLNGYKKLETPHGVISTTKSKSVIIDKDIIPKDERYYSTVIEEKFDKNVLKKLLKEGEKIEGVYIQENINLNVK